MEQVNIHEPSQSGSVSPKESSLPMATKCFLMQCLCHLRSSHFCGGKPVTSDYTRTNEVLH